MSKLVTIPAHGFEPARFAGSNGAIGLIDDTRCGFVHRIDDESGVFCSALADHRVHDGNDIRVRVHEERTDV